ncbi:MAG: bifunctional precorrin-2 dehydrogenase/sirohydrochlorin ferrochelatase [Chloroflexi bacterium]|nr:bifunctional precorrin-2 dehydrogenase/sirohydrochlorin ferrochelatase [Chloroflexota bacterium]
MKKEGQVPAYYPVFLNISGRKCVVVGGGQVALRKVKVLLEHGADVKVISPDPCPELVQLAESGEIRSLNREYRTGDLAGVFVAVAATDDSEINQRVVTEARKGAILVNVVDDAENSDFIVPSYLRRGQVTIAVSTAGKSPALARKIRSRLEKELGDEYALLALLINEVRAEIKREGIKIDGDGWQEALDLDQLLGQLRRGEREKAKATLLSNLNFRGKQGR